MMDRRIYFYGTLCEINGVPVGGGEIGNQRTINLLKRNGYNITIIRKYKLLKKHSLYSRFISCFRILKNYWDYFCILLTGKRKNSIVHISAFYDRIMIVQEFILVIIAKLLGYRIVYEMRGGGLENFCKEYGIAYRFFLNKVLNYVDYIFSQGKENYPIIKKYCNKPIYYYANFVENSFLPVKYPNKDTSIIEILYYGRIYPEKNVDLVILSFKKLLSEKYNVRLTIAGHGPKEYISFLKEKIKSMGIKDFVSFNGPCKHDDLPDLLEKKIFFIFPTTERREGHSNALTENMCYGVIPIANNIGFNKSVINNNLLILDSLTVDDIVNRIKYIIDNNMINDLSLEMYKRVKLLYNEDTAEYNLIQEYNKIFNMFFGK